MPSTSPRRKQDRPIESVTLKLVFRADRDARARIKKAIPSAVFHNESCEIEVRGERPGGVAEKAKTLLETVRAVA